MRAVVEGDLSATARRLVKKADELGWVTVGTVRVEPWSGVPYALPAPRLVIKGRRPGGRFACVFVDGSVQVCYWWTRHHRALVKGYVERERTTRLNAYSVNVGKKLEHDTDLDEEVSWQSETATPEKVTLRALVGVAKTNTPGLLASVDSEVSHG